MKKSGYLAKQEAKTDLKVQRAKETCAQFMQDTLVATLNDEVVMGGRAFGKVMISRIIDAWWEKQKEFLPALLKGVEADYHQDMLDARLRDVYKDDLVPFPERYPWIKKQTY